ncbi:MAG TPA: transcriptional regulator [Acidimicrobiales bacterium]|nr:transcriptional regulator [Acidimicrobiales bacterium]HLN42490.1 transcriptional regulator [Acidimicrobiales bacterium]
MADETVTSADEEFSQAAQSYIRAVGARLRVVRNQLGLSLQAVEAASNHEFKASVLGAYERGERAVSVSRLQRLAKLYGVSVDQLLPNESDATRWWMSKDAEAQGGETPERLAAQPWQNSDTVTIDLTRLRDVSGPERDLIRRFVSMIQVQRQDFNGQLITIRSSDVRAIACLFGMTPDAMGRRLDELSLRVNI